MPYRGGMQADLIIEYARAIDPATGAGSNWADKLVSLSVELRRGAWSVEGRGGGDEVWWAW